VGQVHRRVCFLRLEGREEEARATEQRELGPAVMEARKTSESDSEADALLRAVTSEDEERVAEAIAFAEVLVPMLSERLNLHSPAPGAPARSPRPNRPVAGDPGESRGIADFIDEMLAQQRSGAH
jgi:hypothetical protein